MMHVAHVKSIEIDCTVEMSFLYRYRSVFERRKDFVQNIRCLFNASHVSNNIVALQIDRDRILDDDISILNL